MYDGGKIIAGLIIGVGLLVYPFWPSAGKYTTKAPEPQLTEKAKEAKECVAETSFMRRGTTKRKTARSFTKASRLRAWNAIPIKPSSAMNATITWQ